MPRLVLLRPPGHKAVILSGCPPMLLEVPLRSPTALYPGSYPGPATSVYYTSSSTNRRTSLVDRLAVCVNC